MIEMRVLSSLEKVFPEEAPQEKPLELTALQAETLSFQLSFRRDEPGWQCVRAEVVSPLGAFIRLRQVRFVPVELPMYDDADEDTLRRQPGLFPDRLEELSSQSLHLCRRWCTIWVDVCVRGMSGVFPVEIRLISEAGEVLGSRSVQVEILPAELPEQKLMFTRWFHGDCLAQYYGVEVFSETHWTLMERFIRTAVRCGQTMLLTPIHTPPLDTRVGGERLTIQLADVFVENGVYRFNLDKLRRWIHMCLSCGVKQFEMAHLYTQWGAEHAPKIMATVDGEYRRIFGWDTEAVSPAYRAFLEAYIPAVRQVLREEGVETVTRWHVSDEPNARQLESYHAARRQVDDLLEGCIIMDALSSFEFYQQGVVEHPVVANNHMTPFLAAKTPGLWSYYCCGQYRKVSNMFIAMPSRRNRILGAQLFRYEVEGFLHWGYNFYNSQYSDYPVNPYVTTDADGWVPAGDPFQVYPGPDGEPEESIRLMVTLHALQDLRAMELLAEMESRPFVCELIEQDGAMDFDSARSDDQLLALRQRINREIAKRL